MPTQSASADAAAKPEAAATEAPLVIEAQYPKSACRKVAMYTLFFAVIHYLFWFPIACAIIWFGSGWLLPAGWPRYAAVATIAALYARSYSDRSEFRGKGRAWHWLRMLHFWRVAHDYLRLKLVRTVALDSKRQYVFAWHPHGIIILSRIAMYGGRFEELFPGIDVRTLAATPVFKWPGSREISLWLGAVDAGAKTAAKVLASGLSMMVYPGGVKEIFRTDARSKDTVLDLNNAMGFVRMAMEVGAPLVPVVVYNERTGYKRVDVPEGVRSFFYKKLGIPLLLFYGRFLTLLPFKHQLGVVFGAPLEVPHTPGIQKGDPRIDEQHAKYVAALTTLWEAHKAEFGYAADEKLVIA